MSGCSYNWLIAERVNKLSNCCKNSFDEPSKDITVTRQQDEVSSGKTQVLFVPFDPGVAVRLNSEN